MSEKELADLCRQYFDAKQSNDSLKDIMTFFSKLINAKQMIDITPRLRKYIPRLVGVQDGVLLSFLTSTINGLSPQDYVPTLNLQTNLLNPKEPTKSLSARAPRGNRPQSSDYSSTVVPRLNLQKIDCVDDLEVTQITVPKTSRPIPNAKTLITSRTSKRNSIIPYLQPLPPLEQKEDSILPHLYVSRDPQFYIGKKVSEESHEYHIIPPSYPEHLIGDKFTVLTSTGVIKIDKTGGTVQDVDQFILDNENTVIVENQMISKRMAYRSFYHWRMRLREVIFDKKIATFDQHFAISIPIFQKAMDKIRQDVFLATNDAVVYPGQFDIGNDEASFKSLQQVANQSIFDIDRKIQQLKEEVGMQISESFRIIRAANVLIQLGFDELNSLNQLPPSLKQFSSDLKWRVPSLWREKMRENMLNYERKLARDRQVFLSTFFSKVRINYNGILILKCKEMLMGYLDRFLAEPKNRRKPHKIVAEFNEVSGLITITPTKAEFTQWFSNTLNAIKSAFFQNLEKIWSDIILEADPNYEYTIENPFEVLERYQDFTDDRSEALDSITDAFNFFENEISHQQTFFTTMMTKLNEASKFDDLRNIDKLEILLHNLQKSREDMSKRPKNIFHKAKNAPEGMSDFIVSFSGAVDSIINYYNRECNNLKMRVLNELNVLFSEIQDKWSAVKDTKITRLDARSLEAKTLQYSLLCDSFCGFWTDAFSDVKASFDTVMKMYRQLSDKCRYTHAGAAKHFNKVAETLGLGGVPLVEEEEEEEYYEEETEYEDYSDD